MLIRPPAVSSYPHPTALWSAIIRRLREKSRQYTPLARSCTCSSLWWSRFGAAAFYIVTPMLLVCILFLPSGIIDAVNFGILQLALKISIFILKPSTIFFLLRSVLHLFGSSIRITFGLVRFLARLALKLAWCTVVLATVLSLIAVLLAAALALSEDRDALLETTYTGLGGIFAY